jgi:hypothetical protein
VELLCLLGTYSLQSGNKWRQIFCNGIPYPIVVDVKVGVNEPIPHPDNIYPRDCGEFGFGRWTNASGRLTDNLKTPHDSEGQHLVSREFLPCMAGDESKGRPCCFEHVAESHGVSPRQTAPPLTGPLPLGNTGSDPAVSSDPPCGQQSPTALFQFLLSG